MFAHRRLVLPQSFIFSAIYCTTTLLHYYTPAPFLPPIHYTIVLPYNLQSLRALDREFLLMLEKEAKVPSYQLVYSGAKLL